MYFYNLETNLEQCKLAAVFAYHHAKKLIDFVERLLKYSTFKALPLDGADTFKQPVCRTETKLVHMEFAEWLVHWAPKLASRVRCSTRSSL